MINLFVNNLAFFKSHRYELFKYISSYESVNVYTSCEGFSNTEIKILELTNLKINDINFDRASLNPLTNINQFFAILRIIKKNTGSKNIFISNKLILYGAIFKALKISKNKTYFFFSGLGFIFTSSSYKARIIRRLFLFIVKIASSYRTSLFIVQNQDDLEFFKSKLSRPKNVIKILGNGLKSQSYARKNFDTKIKFLFCSRLLKDKGIYEYIGTAKAFLGSNKKDNVSFGIAGDVDPYNPESLSLNDIEVIKKENPAIDFFDFVPHKRIISFLRGFDVLVLPSYREGLPRIALEASSCGLILLLSDVPGCRECIDNGKNGFLFKPMNILSLSKQIDLLISCRHKLSEMSFHSYQFFNSNFTEDKIFSQYKNLLI